MQRQIIEFTKPLRYAVDDILYRRSQHGIALEKLKGAYKGKPLIVVGNGPSLNRTPLGEFSGIPAIGMNKIDMIFDRTTWRPTIIVCVNNVVAQQHQDVFAQSSIPVFLAWKARWLIKRHNRRKMNYFNVSLSNTFSTDLVKRFGSSATVTYSALQLAYWTDADPVILLGIDHSFRYSGPESTYVRMEGPDQNHFDPNYFKSGAIWGTPDLAQSEDDYILAKTAFESSGRRVLDATVDGKLLVFDKISIEAAILIAKQGATNTALYDGSLG